MLVLIIELFNVHKYKKLYKKHMTQLIELSINKIIHFVVTLM